MGAVGSRSHDVVAVMSGRVDISGVPHISVKGDLHLLGGVSIIQPRPPLIRLWTLSPSSPVFTTVINNLFLQGFRGDFEGSEWGDLRRMRSQTGATCCTSRNLLWNIRPLGQNLHLLHGGIGSFPVEPQPQSRSPVETVVETFSKAPAPSPQGDRQK